MSEYKIENKALPPKKKGFPSKYPFKEMEVGQSFFLNVTEVGKIRTAARAAGKVLSRQYSVRQEGDGYRCGRIK